PAPILAVDRDAAGDRPVDVGKVPRLDVAVGPAGAGEYADRFRDLLLQVHADTGAARVVSYRDDVGGLTGDLGERDGVLESSRPAAVDESGDLELAGLAPQFVTFLDFGDHRVLLKGRVEGAAVDTAAAGGSRRQVEQAGAQGLGALVPLAGRAVGVAPAVAGIVERAGVDQRPVQKVGLRTVGVFVGIEDVDDRELSDRQHQAVLRARPGELADIGVDLLDFAAEIDGLPEESALHAHVGVGGPELVGLAARKSGDAVRVRETETLIDLRGDPQLGALPQPYAGIEGRVERLAAEPAAGPAEGARIRPPGRPVALPHERGLTVKVHQVQIGCGQPGRAAGYVRPAAAEAIVQRCARLLQGKIGCELQPCAREHHADVSALG